MCAWSCRRGSGGIELGAAKPGRGLHTPYQRHTSAHHAATKETQPKMSSGVTVCVLVALVAASGVASATEPIAKSIDLYADNLGRIVDFALGNNSRGWANSTVQLSPHTRTFYVCCNQFPLLPDGYQRYTHDHGNGSTFGNNTWGQADYVDAGRRVVLTIAAGTTATAGAADICAAALARKDDYAAELIAIAQHERLSGYMLDWEHATGNDVACFNELWGAVAAAFKPHGLTMSVSIDDSNHQGPMDLNSTAPWSTEWDFLGFVAWAGALVDMGTYPGSWSQGLSYPAAAHLAAVPCPAYPAKTCGLEGQVLDMARNGVDAASGQLSPGLWPTACSADGSETGNGWTKEALTSFLSFLDEQGVRTVTLWFDDALQTYNDAFTCPWFMPALVDWASR